MSFKLSNLDPGATVLSVDGVGAFDLISRGAMLQGLRGVEGGEAALPFVSLFYSSSCEGFWTVQSKNSHLRCGGHQNHPAKHCLLVSS